MAKIFVIMALLLVLAMMVSGCVSEKEVCNYDGICTPDETDNCADCKGVLGRDVPEPVNNEMPPAP